MAHHDLARHAEILRWPLVEALAAYQHRLRAAARHEYEMKFLAWCILVQSGASKRKRPPELPAILREE